MKFNFKNRVRNFKLAKTDAFVPLFEAITNSVQALEENHNFEKGYVKIKIERDSYRIMDNHAGIFAIEIVDNGIGFVEHNYDSFCTSDSDYKVEIGGKGVGRINWLKAFENVYVDSVYEEEGHVYHRQFAFNIDDEIHDEILEEVSPNSEIMTKIRLNNLNQEFRPATELSLEAIANKIIEHFATSFVIGALPKMEIADEMKLIDLNDYFEKEKFIETKTTEFTSNGSKFQMRHVFLNATNPTRHKIYICAQNRVVSSYDISNIEDMPSFFNFDNKKAIYQCYVSGAFLDRDVNSERTYFSNVIFEDETDDELPHFELAINLYEIVYNQIKEFLKTYLQPMQVERNNQINEYIQTYFPQYEYLTKYASDDIKNISYNIASNKDKLGSELSRLNQKFNQKNTEMISKTLQDASDDVKEKLFALVMPLCENLRSEFTNFINKRAAAVIVLERLMALNLSQEELVKGFFIPHMDEASDANNLWIIDEHLSYPHELIKSDIEKGVYLYQSVKDDNYIAISFAEPTQIKFDNDDNPVDYLSDILRKTTLPLNKINKYVIVNDPFSIVSEGLASKDINVVSYFDLINHYKDLAKTFNKAE